MKTILLCTATLMFAVCNALPFYEKLTRARNQQTSNLCVSLSYSPSPDTALAYVHVCNTPGEGTCILSFIPRCTLETMQNPTSMTATVGEVEHAVLFSTATCEPGVCFYSLVSDCQCNRYPCPCEGTTTPPPTTPPTTTPPTTTPPTTTPPTTTPPTTTPPTTTPPTTTPPTTTPPTTTPPTTTPPTTTPPTTTPPTTTPPPTTQPQRITSPPTTATLPTTLPTTPPCQVSADIYFVIDSTRSLGENGFSVLQSWTASFVDEFSIGSGDNPRQGTARFGVVEFWGEGFFYPHTRRSEVSVALGDYNDRADLVNKINALRYRAGTVTYIESGLEKLLEANQFGINPIEGRQRVAILVSDGQEESSLPDAGVSREWMIGNATEIKRRGIQVFAIGAGDVNLQNLNTIASETGNVFTTNTQISTEVLNRFYNTLVAQLCPETPTRSVTNRAKVEEGCFCSVTNGIEDCFPRGCKANVNSACHCMTLQNGGKLCDPLGCDSVKERNQDKEAIEEQILRDIDIILAKQQSG